MFNAVSQICSNCWSGPKYLEDGDTKENIKHLAQLQDTQRNCSALLPDSEDLAIAGTHYPIGNRIGALWSGVCWGATAMTGALVLAAAKIAQDQKVFEQGNESFCVSSSVKHIAKGVWSVASDAISSFNFSDLSKTIENTAGKADSEMKQLNRCVENPEGAKIGYCLGEGWNSLVPYQTHLKVFAMAALVVGTVWNYKSCLQNQKNARTTLLDGLLSNYDQIAYSLVATFKQAELEKNDVEMRNCLGMATKIRENLPFIRGQIAKCTGGLNAEQRNEIVGKIEDAVNLVLRVNN